MGMEAISPAALKTAAKLCGLTAARLDIDPTSQALILSVRQRGQVHHIDVPIGRTFYLDEICELLTGGPAHPRAIARGPDPRRSAPIGAIVGESPP
jgi:hypothetical protein